MVSRGSWRIRWVGPSLAGMAMVWCTVVLLLHIAGGALSCNGDTSSCASTRNKTTVFEGQLTHPDTSFELAAVGVGKVGGFRTDGRGRYCVVWTSDGGELMVDGQEAGVLSTGSWVRGHAARAAMRMCPGTGLMTSSQPLNTSAWSSSVSRPSRCSSSESTGARVAPDDGCAPRGWPSPSRAQRYRSCCGGASCSRHWPASPLIVATA